MYYVVVKGQIIGWSNDLEFMAKQAKKYSGEIKPSKHTIVK